MWELDLESFASVKAFAARVSTDLARLDVVVENAAIAAVKFEQAERHERTITINVINTFLLALLLLPKLRETASMKNNNNAKPSIVSSGAHGWTSLPEASEENIFGMLDKGDMTECYEVSKLLETFAMRELAPRIEYSGMIVNVLDPGFCHSSLLRNIDSLAVLGSQETHGPVHRGG